MATRGFHSPTLLSYSHTKERTDEIGGLDFRNVVQIQVQYTIARNQLIDRVYLSSLMGKWVNLTLADFSYSTTHSQNPSGTLWKVTGIELPTSDSFGETLIHLGKYTITYERYEDACYSHFFNRTLNADIKDALANNNLKYIQEISDDFNFSRGGDGSYTYDHSVNITFLDTDNLPTATKDTHPIELAKDAAVIILNNQLSHTLKGFLGDKFSTDAFWTSTAIKKYYTESHDLISNACTFKKTFNTNPNLGSLYQYKLTHDFDTNEKGIVTIKESGEVKGIKYGDHINSAKTGVEELLAGAFSRCSVVLSNYIGKIDTSTYASLKDEPLSVSKDFTAGSPDATYNVEYNNDIKNVNGVLIERTLTADKDVNGYVVIKENGTASYMQKSSVANFGTKTLVGGSYVGHSKAAVLVVTALRNYDQRMVKCMADSWSRDDCPAAVSNTIFTTKRSVSYKQQGKSITYSIEATNDPKHRTVGLVNGGITHYITGIEISTNNNLPKPMNSTYPILGWKELVHDSGQTDLGSRSVAVKAVRKRLPGQSILSTPIWPTELINYLFLTTARQKMFQIGSRLPVSWKDFWLTSASCSFNSKGDVSISIDASYSMRRQSPAHGEKPAITIYGGV